MKKFDAGGPSFGLLNLADREPETVFADGALGVSARRGGPVSRASDWPTYAPRPAVYRRFGKRILDTVLITAALPFALPLIGVCALALWIEGGAPFYSQIRLGRNGSRFSILKLRTMTRDADAALESYLAADPVLRREWDEMQKLRNDPRITPVGQFLRATSLDELPQLLNVLRGDMSLVGPRPMLPEQLEMYGDPNAYYALRPGITGLWQVSARNNNRFTYRNEVDATYHRRLTLGCDLSVLAKTVGVVLRRTGV